MLRAVTSYAAPCRPVVHDKEAHCTSVQAICLRHALQESRQSLMKRVCRIFFRNRLKDAFHDHGDQCRVNCHVTVGNFFYLPCCRAADVKALRGLSRTGSHTL